MKTAFEKMQIKAQDTILVVGAPDEFHGELDAVRETRTVVTDWRRKGPFGFALVFVPSCDDIATLAPRAVERLEDDGLLWLAYPKKSSKKYRSDIGRDDGWSPLGDLGYEGVRQIAIDEDWSALRFRHADAIGQMTREKKRALSGAGKAKTTGR